MTVARFTLSDPTTRSLAATALALVVAACGTAPASTDLCVDCEPVTRVDVGWGAADTGGERDDGAADVDDTRPDPRPDTRPDVCVPECGDRQCGDDGCGGRCGSCRRGQACDDGVCVPRGGGGAGLSCEGILECMQGCRDEQCQFDCYERGTPDAREAIERAFECVEFECSWAQTEDEQGRCQQERCGDEIRACFGVEGEVLTCGQGLDCAAGCGPDEGCLQDCFIRTEPTAQPLLEQIFSCAERACDFEGDIARYLECAERNCPAPFVECRDGIQPPPPPVGECTEFDALLLAESPPEFKVELLTRCLEQCSAFDFPPPCYQDCYGNEIGLTADCRLCGGDLVACVGERCGERCSIDGMLDFGACMECVEVACAPEFQDCAGVRW